MSLSQCSTALKALLQFVSDKRDDIVEETLQETISTCERYEIQMERRTVRRKRMPGEQATDDGLTVVQCLRREMFQVSYIGLYTPINTHS